MKKQSKATVTALNKQSAKTRNRQRDIMFKAQDKDKQGSIVKSLLSHLLTIPSNELSDYIALDFNSNSELESISITAPIDTSSTKIVFPSIYANSRLYWNPKTEEFVYPEPPTPKDISSISKDGNESKKSIGSPTQSKSKHRRPSKVFSDGNGCQR